MVRWRLGSPVRVKKSESFSLALNMGWTMLFSLVLPLLVGIWLDKRFDSSPFFVLAGAFLGILAATVGVARMVLRTFSQVTSQHAGQRAEASDEEEPG